MCWLLAVLADGLGELEEAFKHITEATALDPLEPGVIRSFDIITDRIRRALIDPERDPADESTLASTACSSKPTRRTSWSTLRWPATWRRQARATTRWRSWTQWCCSRPACRDAWVVKCIIAKNLGRHEEAAVAHAQAGRV